MASMRFDFDTGDCDMHRIARLSRRPEQAHCASVGAYLPICANGRSVACH